MFIFSRSVSLTGVFLALVTLFFCTGCQWSQDPSDVLNRYPELSKNIYLSNDTLYYLDSAQHQVFCSTERQLVTTVCLDTNLQSPTTLVVNQGILYVAGRSQVDAYRLHPTLHFEGSVVLSAADSVITQLLAVGQLLMVSSYSGNAVYAIDVRPHLVYHQQKAYLYYRVHQPLALAFSEEALFVLSRNKNQAVCLAQLSPLESPQLKAFGAFSKQPQSMVYDYEKQLFYLYERDNMILGTYSLHSPHRVSFAKVNPDDVMDLKFSPNLQ